MEQGWSFWHKKRRISLIFCLFLHLYNKWSWNCCNSVFLQHLSYNFFHVTCYFFYPFSHPYPKVTTLDMSGYRLSQLNIRSGTAPLTLANKNCIFDVFNTSKWETVCYLLYLSYFSLAMTIEQSPICLTEPNLLSKRNRIVLKSF